MPSTSKKQHNFMAAIANSPAFAKKVGVSQSVGKDFVLADKGKKFAKGGVPSKVNNQDTRHGKMDMPFTKLSRYAGLKSGGDMKKMKKAGSNSMAMMARPAMPQNGVMPAPSQPQNGVMPAPSQETMMNGMTGMKKGGMAGMHKMMGGGMAKYAAGGNINAKGAMSGSSHAGENTKIQKKGLTEGKVIKMASGGSVSARADGIAQRGKTKFKMC